MSKCYPNWQRLPNSRMDRQHRAKAFLSTKARTDSRATKIQNVSRYLTVKSEEESLPEWLKDNPILEENHEK